MYSRPGFTWKLGLEQNATLLVHVVAVSVLNLHAFLFALRCNSKF